MDSTRYSTLVLLLAACAPALAAPENKPADANKQAVTQKLKQVQGSVEELTATLTRSREEHARAENDLKTLELKINAIKQSLAQRNENKQKLEQQLAATQAETAQRLEKLHVLRKSLGEQLKLAYRLSDERAQQLAWLRNQDPQSAQRTIHYINYMTRRRTASIAQMQEALAELETNQANLEKQRSEIRQTELSLANEETALRAAMQEKSQVVDRLGLQMASAETQIASLREDAAQLETLLKKIEADQRRKRLGQIANRKGNLAWPAQGPLLNRFGSKRSNSAQTWRGVLIGANAGQPVKAIAPGRVVFADWMRGFGLLMILDHGGGYLSLYGHNSVLLKHVGDEIEEGTVISQVGDTGGLNRAALYFELRYQGKPMDPAGWCKKQVG